MPWVAHAELMTRVACSQIAMLLYILIYSLIYTLKGQQKQSIKIWTPCRGLPYQVWLILAQT